MSIKWQTAPVPFKYKTYHHTINDTNSPILVQLSPSLSQSPPRYLTTVLDFNHNFNQLQYAWPAIGYNTLCGLASCMHGAHQCSSGISSRLGLLHYHSFPSDCVCCCDFTSYYCKILLFTSASLIYNKITNITITSCIASPHLENTTTIPISTSHQILHRIIVKYDCLHQHHLFTIKLQILQ